MTYADRTVGDSWETAARTVTEADVVNFAGVSGDFNDLHLDAEGMANSEYGERIAHGALVFSVLTGLVWQGRPDADREDLVALYGVDDLRFRSPVFVGDTVHVELEVTDKRPNDHPIAEGVVHTDAEVVKADSTVALSCTLLSLEK
ncbi:MaoC family dehydratase N-terminal domain-containing protein [Halorarum halophilum]|uniref:MaoC family dehydratase N-terminal domain-containing protein n=1 Tax=Halorarum halophilum TaxID=2743090 RepID=A0A7D5KHQ0_9EURY|nr:MaoC/PaaZ C-terminal domain-containing protein [Halobaculum halophilum]QLG29356.1 MaoC family dehydratase N-terminal domain-containing protein [Halobaculum halophilum]